MAGRIAGIILIVLGFALLGGELLGSTAIVFLFWPLGIMVWGVFKLKEGENVLGYGLVAVGGILLLDNVLPRQLIGNLTDWWPVLLVFLGILIILGTFEEEYRPAYRVERARGGEEKGAQFQVEFDVRGDAEPNKEEAIPARLHQAVLAEKTNEARESGATASDEPATYPIPEGVSALSVEVDVVAGNFRMREAEGNAIEVFSTTPFFTPRLTLEKGKRGEEDVAFVKVYRSISGTSASLPTFGDWELRVPRGFALEVDADVSAGRFSLEAQNLDLQELRLSNSAGFTEVKFGELEEFVRLKAQNNAGKLAILLPRTFGIDIELDNNVAVHNLDDLGLKRVEDRYISENLDACTRKLKGSVENNAGSFELKYA